MRQRMTAKEMDRLQHPEVVEAERATLAGNIGALWGWFGWVVLVLFAIVRLWPIAWEAVASELAWYHWVALAASLLFLAHAEGYRGFQKSFAPRVAERCRDIRHAPTPRRVLLAPLFAAGFFEASDRRRRYMLTLTTVILVRMFMLQRTPQPWRGIADAGVIVGLTWGFGALIFFGRSILRAPSSVTVPTDGDDSATSSAEKSRAVALDL